MIWFRTDTGITRHRDFVSLRLALGLGRHAVAGHLLCLFEAVAEHHETGNLAGVADTVIEDWSEWRGEAGKFVTALRESGWLTVTNELHGWYKRHASMLTARVKKKEERDEARAASRKAKAEAKKSASKVSKDSPRPSKTNLDEFGPSDPTGPDRTGPKEVEAAPGELFDAGQAKTPADMRAELAANWNRVAERCGLPKVRPDDAPAWAAKADARIAEGVLERWTHVEAGIAAVAVSPRFAAARPKWLKFAHLVANGTNWRKLATDGEVADPPKPSAPPFSIRDVVREAALAVMPESGDVFYDGKPCWLNRGYHGELCAHPPDRKYLIEIDRDVEREVAAFASGSRHAALEAAKSALLRRVKIVHEGTEAANA